jgi:photosystem II stability/assembly factor-like uncharacterized protein
MVVGTTEVGDVAFVAYSTDGGTTWSNGMGPAYFPGLEHVSCASTRDCVAVGSNDVVDYTTDGGSSWSVDDRVPEKQSSTDSFIGVSCASTRDCVAVGRQILAVGSDPFAIYATDGGRSWSVGTLPAHNSAEFYPPELNDVSCASTRDCVAVGGGGAAYTNDGGSSWSYSIGTVLSTLEFIAVSCPSTRDCVALGENDQGGGSPSVAYTTDGGYSWRVVPTPE